jgi:hypothetical protein
VFGCHENTRARQLAVACSCDHLAQSYEAAISLKKSYERRIEGGQWMADQRLAAITCVPLPVGQTTASYPRAECLHPDGPKAVNIFEGAGPETLWLDIWAKIKEQLAIAGGRVD